MSPRSIELILASLFTMALVLFISAPYMCQYGQVRGLDGHPTQIDNADVWEELDPIPGAIYLVGDILCHQDDSRSFHLNGSQMPICARDLCALIGLIIGLIIAQYLWAYIDNRICIILLAVSFSLMIADVIIQNVFDLNVFITRIITGFLCGLSVSLVIDRWMRSIFGSSAQVRKSI